MSTKVERLKTPLLFPCAARVKMPQLGSEDSDLKEGLRNGRFAPDAIVFKASGQPDEPVSKEYLQKVATDLRFEEEVVKERCFHALPYDEKYMYEVFDISDLVSLPPSARIPVGRHDARGKDLRHMPCNLTKSTKSHLKPLKRRIMIRAQQMHLEAARREEIKDQLKREEQALLEKIEETEDSLKVGQEGIFITETKPDVKPEQPAEKPAKESVPDVQEAAETEEKKKRNDWDSYLLSMLSSNTANWIVYERTPVGSQDREKLEPLLKKWYGTPEHTDLIRDETSDTEKDAEEQVKTPKKKWKKKEATLLQKVYDLEEAEPEALDPYSDDNKAPFYRQPAGLRRARKHEEKEELGAINTTAANVVVKTFKPPPPPTLRDFINPSVGQYLIETNNMFQQEQLTGTEQIHENFGDKTKIVMESQNKYKKDFQPRFPQGPEDWFPETEAEKEIQKRDKKKQKRHERGHRRWKALPQPIDDTAELLKVVAPGTESELTKSADPRTRKTAKSNQSLMQIIDEWRTKWHLSGQYVDSTPDDLIKDMADIQAHVRLKAIATCAKAADYRPPADQGIHLDFMEKDNTVESLPERLFVALECLLNDPVDKVKKAAAITLYSLKRPSDEAEVVLYEALQNDNPVDRWAAAQCLAHFGVCDSEVVGEILQQVMSTEDTIKHERGIGMLGILSITSNLVHSMVAEQLNSSSWRHKVIACKILPTLKGDINKDITNKLSDLMWNDWHSEVRRAAAQCLGKTGHGRDVHDDLRTRIMEGDEKLKLEAISKVGQLGLMTAKLLPAFLKCFEDEYISVRSEVCITCGNLAIKDEEIISKLIAMATFDTIWKVKALAFQALGKIGHVTEEIVDCLLWAVRYEEKPGVRAEACHTLAVLKVKTEEVADVIQERFLVESNPLVRDELASTLKMFDISATEDMDMVAQIKKEVKKLCTRNIISSQITLNELDDDRRENMARMIYESEQEMTEQAKPPESVMERIRSLSQLDSSQRLTLESAPSMPEHRDGAFTPSAEQELEAILSKENLTSPTSEPRTTPGSKSRPTTASSTDLDIEDDGKEESETDGEDKSEAKTPSSEAGKASEGDADQEVAKVTERPTSTVKFASHLEVTDIPSRSHSSLGPSRLSLMDEYGKPSRMSQATTTGTEGMVFGRDAVLEREKINHEAQNTFAVMDLRYRDMVQDLIDLDNAFELGLTAGDRKHFEERIQSVKVVRTPPTVKVEKSDTPEMDSDEKIPLKVIELKNDSVEVVQVRTPPTVKVEKSYTPEMDSDERIPLKVLELEHDSVEDVQAIIVDEPEKSVRVDAANVGVLAEEIEESVLYDLDESSDDDMEFFDYDNGASRGEGMAASEEQFSVTIVVTDAD